MDRIPNAPETPEADPAAPLAGASLATGVSGRLHALRERHHVAIEIGFFFAGFLFDVVLLHRIDSRPLLVHQGSYLVLSAALIFWDHRIQVSGRAPTGWLGRIAEYRLWAMHFFLGTLLNAFLVFYFRASSGVLAFGFLAALVGLIVANELPRFRARGPIVRVMMLSFAVTSFAAYLLPVLWGDLRPWQYALAVALGAAATVGLWRAFRRWNRDPSWTFRRAVAPGLLLQAGLLGLYFAKAIPPVPLALKSIGVYYAVQRTSDGAAGRYALRYPPAPRWMFWRRHGERLLLRRGDSDGAREKAHVFMRIFAPRRFHDAIVCQWEYDDPATGWRALGAPYSLPKGIRGGSEEGWHTYASVTGRWSGTYRLRVLTSDGREIGRQTFEIELADDVSGRAIAAEDA